MTFRRLEKQLYSFWRGHNTECFERLSKWSCPSSGEGPILEDHFIVG